MIWTFGNYVLDTDVYELRTGDETIALEPQAFDVLTFLVAHHKRVVTKEELLDEVWGDRFVSESALTSRIKQARRAVGDDGRRQDVIRTVHGRGYRFVAPLGDGTAEGNASSAVSERTTPAAPGLHSASPPSPLGLAPIAQPVRTHYTRSSGLDIAYQVVGEGPDLLFIPGFVSNVDLQWEHPAMAAFYRRLASFSRLILFDKRGTGVSERVTADRIPSLEERMDDVRAVLDAAGSERVTLFGISEGGPLSLLMAATYPERVERLVLYGTFATDPFVDPARFVRDTRRLWGRGQVFSQLAPSWSDDDANVTFLARYERQSATPDGAARLLGMIANIDARSTLSSISAPTLILHRRDDEVIPFDRAEVLAAGIAGAELVALDGNDHHPCVDPDPILDRVQRHVTGAPSAPPAERVLTTMLYVDVASSTSKAAGVGDTRGADLPAEFVDRARRQLARTGGTLVNTTGDGLLATFDGPARAVRCGLALVADLANLGLDVRCSAHTSEVERLADDITGIGVRVGARVEDLARPGEVLVTRTVRDLVVGSGLHFKPRGRHELRGVPECWDLYAASG